jgi:hypothetical protein
MIGCISDDGRILPVSVTEGLVPPDPWSPWLSRSESPGFDGATAGFDLHKAVGQ